MLLARPRRAAGVPLPTVSLTNEMLTAARGLGLAGYDFAVVFDVARDSRAWRRASSAEPAAPAVEAPSAA